MKQLLVYALAGLIAVYVAFIGNPSQIDRAVYGAAALILFAECIASGIGYIWAF